MFSRRLLQLRKTGLGFLGTVKQRVYLALHVTRYGVTFLLAGGETFF
jgi:hypothetical protein